MRLAACLWSPIVLVGVCAAQDTNFSVGPQYLITTPSTMFLHPIETPSLSFGPGSAPALPVATETVTASQVIETPPPVPTDVNLATVFWGEPSAPALVPSEIEVSGKEPPKNLPASFIDVGVSAFVEAQTLRDQGYGLSLAETAAYWKAHGAHASHTYTNKDIEHSHGS